MLTELRSEVRTVLRTTWTERDGRVVPDTDSLKLGNDAIKIKGTVLYADLSASTKLVDTNKPHFAAGIYKVYLLCAARLIRGRNGTITAYDGDRIMAVYTGDGMVEDAVRTALQINACVQDVINPLIKESYPSSTYQVQQTVGIDVSDLFVAKTGVRGANDLVWVGRAANHAAKLAAMKPTYATWITSDLHTLLPAGLKKLEGGATWQRHTWNAMDGRDIYACNWTIRLT
jgi:class 3 adenylate cyclase